MPVVNLMKYAFFVTLEGRAAGGFQEREDVGIDGNDGDEFVMVKWLHKSELGTDYVKLVSENRHHQPKDFHIKHIKGLALIKASVRINSMY